MTSDAPRVIIRRLSVADAPTYRELRLRALREHCDRLGRDYGAITKSAYTMVMIGKDEAEVTGYVDLVSERAYKYHPGQESDLIQMPAEVLPREQEARNRMLESLADFDDHLMEEILSDVAPPKGEIYQQFAKDLAADLIVPVLLGEAEKAVMRGGP